MADVHGEERLFEVDPVVVERMETAPGGPVHKVFRHYDPNQDFLIPPSLDDWLDKDHLARFVAKLVDEVLDLSSFLASYKEPRGYPPYDPRRRLDARTTRAGPRRGAGRGLRQLDRRPAPHAGVPAAAALVEQAKASTPRLTPSWRATSPPDPRRLRGDDFAQSTRVSRATVSQVRSSDLTASR